MSKLAVLTDSTASIPENILQELNIHTIAYYIHRGQEVLRTGDHPAARVPGLAGDS